MGPFSLAKEGVIGLSRTAAKELGRFGITCNAIRPFAVGPSVRDYQTRVQKWGPLLTASMGAGASGDRDPDEFSPAKISPFVAWLCTEAAHNVTGRTFHVSGDDIALYTEPTLDHLIHHDGGWTLDALDAEAPTELVAGLTTYTLDEYPQLQIFEA